MVGGPSVELLPLVQEYGPMKAIIVYWMNSF